MGASPGLLTTAIIGTSMVEHARHQRCAFQWIVSSRLAVMCGRDLVGRNTIAGLGTRPANSSPMPS